MATKKQKQKVKSKKSSCTIWFSSSIGDDWNRAQHGGDGFDFRGFVAVPGRRKALHLNGGGIMLVDLFPLIASAMTVLCVLPFAAESCE
jgi:hypothetical protein